jgi:hypothetical protein
MHFFSSLGILLFDRVLLSYSILKQFVSVIDITSNSAGQGIRTAEKMFYPDLPVYPENPDWHSYPSGSHRPAGIETDGYQCESGHHDRPGYVSAEYTDIACNG